MRAFIPLAGATLLLASGCVDRDPYRRTDVWYPTGAPAGNLAAMVANPTDLLHGRGVDTSVGQPAVSGVNHVLTDHPKPLLDPGGLSSSNGGSGAGSSGSGGGGSPPPGG